jgi:hypothetical protein
MRLNESIAVGHLADHVDNEPPAASPSHLRSRTALSAKYEAGTLIG